jgi:hypothetical protein
MSSSVTAYGKYFPTIAFRIPFRLICCRLQDKKHWFALIVVSVPGYRSSGPGSISVYQIFLEVLGLERGPLSLVSTTEELLGRKSGCGLEKRDYGRKDPLR